MDGLDALHCLHHMLLAQQLREHIEDDAIVDAEEEVQWSGNDASRVDGEEGRLPWMEGVSVAWLAIALLEEQSLVEDCADGTGVRGGSSLQTQQSAEEGPVTVEQRSASVDEMLQHCEDVREGSRVAGERRQSIGLELREIIVLVAALARQQTCEVLLASVLERDAQLQMPTSSVTSHCDEGGLRTQDRHEADGVSHER